MPRKPIYLNQRRNNRLKRLAQASEGAIAQPAFEQNALAGLWLGPGNPAAWDTLLQGLKARATLAATAEPYTWRRADAYEEREG